MKRPLIEIRCQPMRVIFHTISTRLIKQNLTIIQYRIRISTRSICHIQGKQTIQISLRAVIEYIIRIFQYHICQIRSHLQVSRHIIVCTPVQIYPRQQGPRYAFRCPVTFRHCNNPIRQILNRLRQIADNPFVSLPHSRPRLYIIRIITIIRRRADNQSQTVHIPHQRLVSEQL